MHLQIIWYILSHLTKGQKSIELMKQLYLDFLLFIYIYIYISLSFCIECAHNIKHLGNKL